MPLPLPSSRRQRRQQNLGLRLTKLLDALLDDAVRLSARLPPSVAGPWRRTLTEAAALLGPGLAPAAGSVRPYDFFLATVRSVHALAGLRRLQDKGFRRKLRWTYPRSPERE